MLSECSSTFLVFIILSLNTKRALVHLSYDYCIQCVLRYTNQCSVYYVNTDYNSMYYVITNCKQYLLPYNKRLYVSE